MDRPAGGGVILEARRRRARIFRIWVVDLYVMRSFLFSYLLCGVSFTGLYIVVEAFSKLNQFIPSGHLSPVELVWRFAVNLARYHMAMIPTIYANYMGPILTLAAAMFTLTLMNRGNEFTPIKAAGVGIFRVLAPIFILAAGFSGLTFALAEWVIPELREPIRQAISLSRSGALRPEPFYDPEHQIHIAAKQYTPDVKVGEGVTIQKWHGDIKEVWDAERIVWVPHPDSTPRREKGAWLVRNGSIQRWNEDGELILNEAGKDFDRLKEPFKELWLKTSLLPIDLETSDQDISYLSWRELEVQYERQPYHHHLITRLHYHFAFPFSHIVLLFLGIPFVMNFQTRSFFLGLAASFALCAAYFLLSSMALSLASDPGSFHLHPVIAAWLPNILFGSLGLTIFTNMRT